MKQLTKKEVLKDFREYILPGIRKAYEKDGRVDHPARAQAWSNYTDSLMKEGIITAYQDRTWSNPF